jgi:hypothetical protein
MIIPIHIPLKNIRVAKLDTESNIKSNEGKQKL